MTNLTPDQVSRLIVKLRLLEVTEGLDPVLKSTLDSLIKMHSEMKSESE